MKVLIVVTSSICQRRALHELLCQGFELNYQNLSATKKELEVRVVIAINDRQADQLSGLCFDWVIYYDGADEVATEYAKVKLASLVRSPT